jgi:poly-gamma-glutamate capsule biosynthesis protein CapA/YwtB (metallophosphatase superfamily)
MTGRGIDQILPHPSLPRLYESSVDSALDYVRLAELRTGRLPRPVDMGYVWGDALSELERLRPQARIVNLETAVTVAGDAWPDKGIHYRMHPANVGCLTAAGIDCCVLANNHVLDWGRAGLEETLDTLRAAGIGVAGAGRDAREARAPAIVPVPGGRVLVFAFGVASAGVSSAWSATGRRSGVWYLDGVSARAADDIGARVSSVKRAGDVAIASIHWGDNWGYDVGAAERAFAQRLIDVAGIDLVHGHSSHHPKGVEVYRGKLILYGCGDFLNDYEGIAGYERFRGDLTLMYLPTLDLASGRLRAMMMTPLAIRHFRLNRVNEMDARWLRDRLDAESRRFGASVSLDDTARLHLRWSE